MVVVEWESESGGRDDGDADAPPAEGAISVALKPHVDAINVEDMAAVRDAPQLLLLLELAEANGAFQRAPSSSATGLSFVPLSELENGDRPYHGLFETTAFGGGGWEIERRRRVVEAAAAAPAPAGGLGEGEAA